MALTFFDFCAGIGGGRLGLELNGLECVGHCEIDPKTAETYARFYDDNRNFGDLTTVAIEQLPDFDLMIAGFPCQTFSIVGKRAGFEDDRGLVIYSLIEILKQKKVKYFILENVKGLVNHDKGRTFRIIQELLEEAGYTIYFKVLNSCDYGVPHLRERIYIVGFLKELDTGLFTFPEPQPATYQLSDYFDSDNTTELPSNHPTFQKYLQSKYNKGKYEVSDLLTWENEVLDWRQSDLRRYETVFPTLRTGRHGLLYVKDGKLKKLNGYESLLLQGFPKEIAEKVKSDDFYVTNKVLSQAGNAMTVNVIQAIGRELLLAIGDF